MSPLSAADFSGVPVAVTVSASTGFGTGTVEIPDDLIVEDTEGFLLLLNTQPLPSGRIDPAANQARGIILDNDGMYIFFFLAALVIRLYLSYSP